MTTCSAHWWISEFRGVGIPAGSFTLEQSRVWSIDTLAPTGTPFGLYKLDGAVSRQENQTVTFEAVTPDDCPNETAAWFDTLLHAGQKSGVLKKSNGRMELLANASIMSVRDATTIDDIASGHKRTAITFTKEPFWYGPLKTVSFTSVTSYSLDAPATRNEGNARAVKFVRLTITNDIAGSISSPFIINISPVSFGSPCSLGITANLTAPVVIDAGANTVRANAVNAYADVSRASTQIALLHLEGRYLSNGVLRSNNSTITFSAPTTGSLEFRDTWI